MAHRTLAVAFSIMVTGTTVAAASPGPIPPTAPPGNAATRYCMRVETATGTLLLERVKCLTRDEWDFQGVNVDKDWPKEGVRVIEG